MSRTSDITSRPADARPSRRRRRPQREAAALLLCHEGGGLDDNVKRRAERLVALGDAAVALDDFGDGRPMNGIGAAMELLGPIAAGLRAVVGLRPGLGMGRPQDSTNITASVLLCVGSDDPFAAAEQRLAARPR